MGKLLEHFLKHVSVILNNQCNTNCIFCFVHSESADEKPRNSAKVIDETHFRRIIDRVKPFYVSLHLPGDGEPFLHPGVWELIGYARPNVKSIEVLTNLISNENDFVDRIFLSGIDAVLVNLPAPTKEAYALQRPGLEGDFARVISTLEEIHRRKGGVFGKPFVVLSIVLNKLNAKPGLLRKQVLLASRLGILKVKVREMIESRGTGKFLPQLDNKAIGKLASQIMEFGVRNGVYVEFFGVGPGEEIKHKPRVVRECTLTGISNLDKSISFCCFLREEKLKHFFESDKQLEDELRRIAKANKEKLCIDCPFIDM